MFSLIINFFRKCLNHAILNCSCLLHYLLLLSFLCLVIFTSAYGTQTYVMNSSTCFQIFRVYLLFSISSRSVYPEAQRLWSLVIKAVEDSFMVVQIVEGKCYRTVRILTSLLVSDLFNQCIQFSRQWVVTRLLKVFGCSCLVFIKHQK